MSVGAGSIKRATASAKPAEAPVEAKESVAAAAKKTATPRKTAAAKKSATPRKTAAAKKPAPKEPASPKTAVITGANPDIEFYHISEDLPIHLL